MAAFLIGGVRPSPAVRGRRRCVTCTMAREDAVVAVVATLADLFDPEPRSWGFAATFTCDRHFANACQ
jgi:hypothetical protein